MNITMILEVPASAGDRAVITAGGRSPTASELPHRADGAAHRFRRQPAVVHPGADHLARPAALIIRGGENIAPAGIRQWVRDRLRSSRTPDAVVFRAELPKTETGKPLRRTPPAELETTHA